MNGSIDQEISPDQSDFHPTSMVENEDENLSTNTSQEENPTNKSFKRKAVSFSAMPFEKKVADGNISTPRNSPPHESCFFSIFSLVCDCLRYMQEGSDFLKVRSYARQFRRLYKLNESLTAISWTPTTKKPSKAMSNSQR